jgi:hypothetical protein
MSRKNFFLDKYGIDFLEVDLNQLISGPQFIVFYLLSMNRYSITLRFFFNTGANGFAFVNTRYATNITNFFDLEFAPLPAPIPVKGYNSKSRANITQILRIYFIINRRRLFNLLLLILDLGFYNIILEYK